MEIELDGRRHVIRHGSHLCQLYSTPDEALSVAAMLLARGLEEGYRCIWAGQAERALHICGAMELRQPGLYRRGSAFELPDEQALAELAQAADSWTREQVACGRLVLVTDRASLSPGPKFDPYHTISFQLTEVDRAARDALSGIVVVVDMTWVATGRATSQQLLKHEAAADAVFAYQNRPLIALAQYDRQKTEAGLIAELLKLHRLSILGRSARLNPQHVDADRYVAHIIKASRQERSQRNGRQTPYGLVPRGRSAGVAAESEPPVGRGRARMGLDGTGYPELAPPSFGRQARVLIGSARQARAGFRRVGL